MFCTKFASLCRFPTSLVRRLGPHSQRHPSLTYLYQHQRTLPIRAGKHLGAYSVQLHDARCFSEGSGRPEEMSEEQRQQGEKLKERMTIFGILVATATVGLVAARNVFKDAGQLSSEQAPVTVEERRALRKKYWNAWLGIWSASTLAVLLIPFTWRCMWKHPGVWGVGGMTVWLICHSVAMSLPYDYEKRFDLKHGAWLTAAVFHGATGFPLVAWFIGRAAVLIGEAAAPALASRAVGGAPLPPLFPTLPLPLSVAFWFACGCFIFSVYKVYKKDNRPFDPMY